MHLSALPWSGNVSSVYWKGTLSSARHHMCRAHSLRGAEEPGTQTPACLHAPNAAAYVAADSDRRAWLRDSVVAAAALHPLEHKVFAVLDDLLRRLVLLDDAPPEERKGITDGPETKQHKRTDLETRRRLACICAKAVKPLLK